MNRKKVTADGTLLQKTKELLHAHEDGYLAIYKATGLKPNWLTDVARGKISDPSVNRVQALYEHLSQKTITL